MRLCEQLGPVRDADWPPPLACPKWDLGRAVGAHAASIQGRAYVLRCANIVRASVGHNVSVMLGVAVCRPSMHARQGRTASVPRSLPINRIPVSPCLSGLGTIGRRMSQRGAGWQGILKCVNWKACAKVGSFWAWAHHVE